MKKHISKTLIIVLAAFLVARFKVFAQETPVNIHLFWAEGCPHCEQELAFLTKLQEADPNIHIQTYEISKSTRNTLLLTKVSKKLNVSASGVPFTVIGEKYFVGYGTEETHGTLITELVKQAREQNSADIVAEIANSTSKPKPNPQITNDPTIPEAIKVPLIGLVNIKTLSLPALTFVIALADGFNPCAMWVLLFLISLLLGMANKKRMVLLGSTFIGASGLVYFLFLTAWLNLFLFLGYVSWIRVAIGGIALFAGYQYLKEYITNKDGGCKVIGGNEKRQQVFAKLRSFVAERNLLLSLGGIALLAFGVNVVEFVCSVGLPAVYTKILTLSDLPALTYYMYLIFYVFIFMLDDILIFTVAMATLKAVGIESKYARVSHLIGGLLMLGIGLLMLFKPELLMFG